MASCFTAFLHAAELGSLTHSGIWLKDATEDVELTVAGTVTDGDGDD